MKRSVNIISYAVILFLLHCGNVSQNDTISDISDHRQPGMPCYYDGDDFEVIYRQQRYTESADDNYAAYKIACGDVLAALYDGDYFRVFDGTRRVFDYDGADDDYAHSLIAVGSSVAAMYDGDYFRVYDTADGQFEWDSADDNYSNAVLDAYGDIAVMYDGDYVRAYANGKFYWSSADDDYARAEVIIGRGGALVYDGDYLHYFCASNNSWNWSSVDDNAAARGYLETNEVPGMFIGRDYYVLDTARCQLREI